MLPNEEIQIKLDSYPIVLTAKEICEILRISKPSAYALMDRTDFPLLKIGRCKRVVKDQFIKWLNGQNENIDSLKK